MTADEKLEKVLQLQSDDPKKYVKIVNLIRGGDLSNAAWMLFPKDGAPEDFSACMDFVLIIREVEA